MNIGIKIQRTRREDLIWVIYFFIALAAIISDHYERIFLLTKNPQSQKKFKTINIAIFIVALFIYLYFVFLNYEDISELKRNATKKEVLNRHIGLISALLFLVGGVLALYAEIFSTNSEDIGL